MADWLHRFRLCLRRAGCESGATAVEFALVCPVLLGLCGAIVEGGLLIYTRGNMEHVARQMARGVAIGTFTEVQAEDEAEAEMARAIGSPDATATVDKEDGLEAIDDKVIVTISIASDELDALKPFNLIPVSSLQAVVTMHTES